MPANSISIRVAEFLAKYPPFDLCSTSELQRISEAVTIRYLEPGEVVFEEGYPPGSFFYVVRQGSVKIFHSTTDELVDICDEGDIFGVRPLLANEPYLASAQTQEECLLYAIPVEEGKMIIQNNARVSMFFAMGYASGKPMQRLQRKQGKFSGMHERGNQMPVLNETIAVQGTRDVLTCHPQTSVAEAARMMEQKKVSSIIVVDQNRPLGIVTDKDFRRHVATGAVGIQVSVSSIMSSPVKCVKAGLSVAECMIQMVNYRVHHLCVTQDGSPQSNLTGIISDHDLLLEQGFNPAIIIKEMRKSSEISAMLTLREKADHLLQSYLEQEVSMGYVSKMMAAVNDALLQRLTEMVIEELGEPPCLFAWLSLGSQGRGEQLLRTDQDHALAFEDGLSAEQNDGRRIYFLQLANRVAQHLERFGFAQDVADIGANHAEWCLSLQEWKGLFTRWVQVPDEKNILLCTIFLDFRPAYGHTPLAADLSNHLFDVMQKSQLFLPRMAQNAMANPSPLSFFRNFVVERSGEHKDAFDLKLRAMLPLVDAARVLILQHKIPAMNNTVSRYEKLAELEPNHVSLMREASEGYAFLSAIRARFGLKNLDSGRFIKISELSKLQRQQLRHVFDTIDELQKLMRVRFQTAYLGS
jgi:CBS domain-containing protein